ncbi:MAG: hypothetical protein A2606_01605 [Candidatus Yanofskybacteria bacterium RIFOXYD1_FULL_42_10]|uniref:Uncharacterized protein n=5 Tax=Parcubacteria group TaxID=1794811 RepID=A0A1F8HWP6_9BACT|nr:MAG: hypothetical protein A2606_01605 [Candidatus Yanofskybacteria bacterium RIFOXYD1_FULL_42_10]
MWFTDLKQRILFTFINLNAINYKRHSTLTWRGKMAKTVKLYDLRERNYPHNRGDKFRSLQIFECWVCGALSNQVIMGGYLGYGVRVVCPNSSECWHHELEEKLKWLEKLYPKSYKQKFQKEITVMKRQHKAKIKNDIEGKPNMSLKRPMTNTFSWNTRNKPCSHRNF